MENAGCEFILTNPDVRFPMKSRKAADPSREGSDTSYLPEAGAMAAAVSACVGRQPIVCGKPSPLAMELICSEHNIDKSRTAMVGDTLYTDIAFGNGCGVRTVLVLSGNTNAAVGAAAEGSQKPDLIVSSVAELKVAPGTTTLKLRVGAQPAAAGAQPAAEKTVSVGPLFWVQVQREKDYV